MKGYLLVDEMWELRDGWVPIVRLKVISKLPMVGENMLFNMIWEDGYWWETLWKECKKLTCSCKECMFFNIGRKGFHLVSMI